MRYGTVSYWTRIDVCDITVYLVRSCFTLQSFLSVHIIYWPPKNLIIIHLFNDCMIFQFAPWLQVSNVLGLLFSILLAYLNWKREPIFSGSCHSSDSLEALGAFCRKNWQIWLRWEFVYFFLADVNSSHFK